MENLLIIVGVTLFISVCALIGVFTLSMKDEFLRGILLKLVSLSSGALLGGAMFHLIPEGIAEMDGKMFFMIMLFSILFYFLVEKVLHWRHCHKGAGCGIHHSMGYMNLIGDAVHNFIDGLVIAAAFITDFKLGVVTAIAMALHEIPQEIGDFGVLLYSGFSKKKALFYNFLVALCTVLGGIAGWVASFYSANVEKYLLPVAAGGFIYIAISDLLPEIRKEEKISAFLVNFLLIMFGIGLIMLVGFFELE